MKQIKTFMLALCALVSVATTYGSDAKSQFVLDKFLNFYTNGIDEKLYLQTDKPYYSAGEQIWFKGYLLNAITHAPLNHSNFIYVELIDSEGKLFTRVKVKRGAGGLSGYINTQFDQKPGGYTLRAYTKWMQNGSDKLFFTKNIEIVSPVPPKVNEEGEESLSARAVQRAEEKAAKEAAKLAEKKLDYTVQFFPEGGALIAGVAQNVAFKAVAEDGLSIEVKGKIFDSKNQEITQIESMHKGMGLTLLSSSAGSSYYAVVESSEGVEKKFNLPAVESQGAAIQIARMNGKVFYKVNTTSPEIIKGAYVVIHSRGKIVAIDSGNLAATRSIADDQLFTGISVIALVNAENKVISERLVFKQPTSTPSVEFESDALNYQRRKRALFTARIKSSDGTPAVGEFGVSVVDNKSVVTDPNKGDINSYLLLNSDIVGHVEEPGLYFADNTALTQRKLDLLMMTQGWRRFKINDVLSESGVKKGEYSYENVVSINGEVKGFFGNAARKPQIFVLCSQLNIVEMFQLDNTNKFNIHDVNIPDSTTYIIQAQGRSGGKTLTLNIKPEEFPQPKAGYYVRLSPEEEEQAFVPFEFINQSQQKFYYEGGTAMLALDAVYVEADNNDDDISTSFSSTRYTTRQDLDDMSGMTLADIMMTYPGVSIENNTSGDDDTSTSSQLLYYRSNSTYMRIYLDGSEVDYDMVSNVTSEQIERIDLLDGVDAAMYSDAAGGILQITLREGVSITSDTMRPNIAHISWLGYQRSATFYQPNYDSPSVERNSPPDYRTTIYWNGELKSNENGEVQFDFFTADSPTDYTVTIEGVTQSGEICHATTTIQRKAGN